MTRSESTRGASTSRATSVAVGLVAATLVLSAPVAPAPAAAENDAVGARVLFSEGRKLADAGQYAEACQKFEESLRLDPGVGTSFNLADCEEHLGRTASAWARFLDVAAATRQERQRVARARAAALEPRLARLTVEVVAPVAAGLIVERDGLLVGPAAWGVAVPVDPGVHLVSARAPGRQGWSARATVPEAPTTVVVSVPALDASIVADRPPPSAPAGGPGVSSSASASRPEALAVASSGAQPRRWWLPVVGLGALGAAGLATGGVLALEVRSENDEAVSLCPGSSCASVAEKTRHDGLVGDARTQRTVAVACAGIGAAALLTGAYLWWRGARAPGTASASLSGSVDGRMVLRPGVGLEPGMGRGLAGVTLLLGW
jgi:hypothetical protein